MIALGLVLLVLGLVLLAVEAHAPTLGALGLPGAAATVVGAGLAVDGLGGGIALGVTVAVLLGAASTAFFWLVVPRAAAVRRRRIRSGPEQLPGQLGVVRSWRGDGSGQVLVDGALWRACIADPDELGHLDAPAALDPSPLLRAGDAVVVERRSGLTLADRRAERWETAL